MINLRPLNGYTRLNKTYGIKFKAHSVVEEITVHRGRRRKTMQMEYTMELYNCKDRSKGRIRRIL